MVKGKTQAEIIAVGSELLSPYFVDTNSLYLTGRLNDLGIEVSFKTIVGDERENLLRSFKDALSRSNLIITIGGLGPTEDDRTREVVAEVLGRKLVLSAEELLRIKTRFRKRKMAMPVSNRKQAYLIDGAEVLENKNGTASGMWIDHGKAKVALLPGPPHELKPMFETSIWPRLKRLKQGFSERRVLKTTGLTESKIETLISDLYPTSQNLRLTPLAKPGQIEILLTSYGGKELRDTRQKLAKLEAKIRSRLGENVFSSGGEEIEEVVGRLLKQRRKTLAVAESCTGGFLSHRITNVPGSSVFFLESVVSYSNEAKVALLGVPERLLEKHGAVSSQVARAMAAGIRTKAGSDYSLAITGIAGPTGGTPEKPVGLVYTALAWDKGVDVERNLFLGKREQVKFQSSQKALDMLRRVLIHIRGKRPYTTKQGKS